MWGRNLLDLSVIKENTIVNNINMSRPMIDFIKTLYFVSLIIITYHILKILLIGLLEVNIEIILVLTYVILLEIIINII